MNRSPDILFSTEYIKETLYFATVRQGKSLKSVGGTHYFCIDNELLYENYYSDFGPLNLGCVFKYCKLLNVKLKQYMNRQVVVHYTSIDPKNKVNAAFLLGCFGVLYLGLSPRDALKPLMLHGQSYRQFQDASQGDSNYTISLLDCIQAMKKARDLGLFNFYDFNLDEYNRLDKIQGGDLNWIVPGKFLAFIGPVDYSVSLYHPPEMYIDYFLNNNVKIVIRLNKRLYDGNIFNNAGIIHYDLFFPDGSCPPRHILMKFLQISEESEGAIAVHCKAGLGRTGSLIGSYLIKHYRMSAHEAIAWMRICRPGSVIGHQQEWLELLETWLNKQGNIYRKRMFNDVDKFPYHEFGIYSIAEKTMIHRPIMLNKSPSPSPPPLHKMNKLEITVPLRPQSSKKIDKAVEDEEEVFLTSCDLTTKPPFPMTQMKGCIIKNSTISEEYDEKEMPCSYNTVRKKHNMPRWKRILLCKPCCMSLRQKIWMISVRCAKVAPSSEKMQLPEWRANPIKTNIRKDSSKGQLDENGSKTSRRSNVGAAGEPRPHRSNSKFSKPTKSPSQKNNALTNTESKKAVPGNHPVITTFRTTQGPLIKNVDDAKSFLIRSSKLNDERTKQLSSSVTVTPQKAPIRDKKCFLPRQLYLNDNSNNSSTYSTAAKGPTQPQQRRRLGRSPSPPQTRSFLSNEHTRATNTQNELLQRNESSKVGIRDALSRLKLSSARDGSIGAASVGAASLGARRDAPSGRRAPSVRSDERPLATQGDMLNSIKFQRRFRDSLVSDTISDRSSLHSKDKGTTQRSNAKPVVLQQDYMFRDKTGSSSKNISMQNRPMSPKGRRSPNTPSFY